MKALVCERPISSIAVSLLLFVTAACSRSQLYLYSTQDRRQIESIASVVQEFNANSKPLVVKAKNGESELIWQGEYNYPLCSDDVLCLAAGNKRVVRGTIKIAAVASDLFPNGSWAELYAFYILTESSLSPLVIDAGIVFADINSLPQPWRFNSSLPSEALIGTLPITPVRVYSIQFVEEESKDSGAE